MIFLLPVWLIWKMCIGICYLAMMLTLLAIYLPFKVVYSVLVFLYCILYLCMETFLEEINVASPTWKWIDTKLTTLNDKVDKVDEWVCKQFSFLKEMWNQ